MNEEARWNNLASTYDGEIFDVFRSDKNNRLAVYFKKHANLAHQAIDFGCGIGKAFQYLASGFEEVIAMDISSKCLSIAKTSPYKNISFKRADLTKRNLKLPQVDFVFCCNVIMLPEIEKNVDMLRNVCKALKQNGNAVIVVPAMESILFSSWRLIDWYRREGVRPEKIPNSELSYFQADKRRILQGIIHIDGVPTKHYSEPELRVLFGEAKLTMTAIEKLEYEWDTEFPSPPDWMKAPYPWDWLIECKKTP